MKRFLRTTLMSVRFLFLILLPPIVKMEEERCRSEDRANAAVPFRLLHKDVCPLTKNIANEATYDFRNHCAMKCSQNPFCVGYNFKKKQQKKTANCQITQTLDHHFHDCNADDKGWIFYLLVAPKKVEFEKDEKTTPKLLSTRQECSSYTWLNNPDRNIKYTGGGGNAICDNGMSTGWYRFGGAAGTQLPTSCIDRTDKSKPMCYTHGVSWLNGVHPSVADEKVTRTVCFSWDGNCCRVQKNIEVINCGFFYIYEFVSLSGWCQRRYCGTDV